DAPQRELRMSIGGRHSNDTASLGQNVPPGAHHRCWRVVDQAGDGLCWTDGICEQRLEQAEFRTPALLLRINTPARIEIDDLEPVERRGPFPPLKLRLRRVRVRRDTESAKTVNVFDDVSRFTTQRIWRHGHVERNVVAAG